MAVKLMDLIVPPWLNRRHTTILLKEGPATLVNKVPFFSLICDHCDIFTASPRIQFRPWSPHEITGYATTAGRARPPRQAAETAKAALKMGKA